MWYLAGSEPWARDEVMPLGTFLGWLTALGYKKHTGHKYPTMVKLTKVSYVVRAKGYSTYMYNTLKNFQKVEKIHIKEQKEVAGHIASELGK